MTLHAGIKKYGFSLIELMTVISITALLLTTIIAGYQTLVRNSKINTVANRLYSSLCLARSYAINNGIPTGVCPILTSDIPTSSNTDISDLGGSSICQNNITNWQTWQVYQGSTTLQIVADIPNYMITTNLMGAIVFDPMGFARITDTSYEGWTWGISANWKDVYSSSYDISTSSYSSYFRTFTIMAPNCISNKRTIEIAQNGSIALSILGCD